MREVPRGEIEMTEMPIPTQAFLQYRHDDEPFKSMLQRLDTQFKNDPHLGRTKLAEALQISKRQLYRLIAEYQISEYRPNGVK